jgi:hypothetical protein
MVAASATAILNDINLSAFFRHPFGGLQISRKARNKPLARTILKAGFDQPVSTLGWE